MEVTSTMKPSTNTNGGSTATVVPTGPKIEKKVKTRVHLKKIAREHGKNKSPQSEAELLTVGKKRGGGELIFDEEEEVIVQKRRWTAVNTNHIEFEER